MSQFFTINTNNLNGRTYQGEHAKRVVKAATYKFIELGGEQSKYVDSPTMLKKLYSQINKLQDFATKMTLLKIPTPKATAKVPFECGMETTKAILTLLKAG